MPFPNEHAARQADPKAFDSFRRMNRPQGAPAGISFILGIKDGKSTVQSVRFDAKKWTPAKAKAWLKEHKFKTGLEEATSTKKAAWDTAFINNLPDAAFAIILPGGKKDKEGKTVPRRLRVLPHHNANVQSPTENTSVDLPHLRNALARAPQSDLSDADKRKAIAHLEAHAKKLLPSHKPKEKPVNKGFWGGVL